jgi:hypothetical protein
LFTLFLDNSGFLLIVEPNVKAGFGVGTGVAKPEASSMVSNFGLFARGSSALVVGRRLKRGGTNFFMLYGGRGMPLKSQCKAVVA